LEPIQLAQRAGYPLAGAGGSDSFADGGGDVSPFDGMVGNEAQRAEGILASTAKNIFIGLLIL